MRHQGPQVGAVPLLTDLILDGSMTHPRGAATIGRTSGDRTWKARFLIRPADGAHGLGGDGGRYHAGRVLHTHGARGWVEHLQERVR